jgi:hypothetical protein
MHINAAAFEMVPQNVQSTAMSVHLELSKNRIPHAIVGGMAFGAYADKGRMTSDVDVLVPSTHKTKVERMFPDGQTGFAPHGRFELWKTQVEGTDVDFLFADDLPSDFFSDVSMVGGLPVISPRGLTALKIRSGRMKDKGDIIEILKSQLRKHPDILSVYFANISKPQKALKKVLSKVESLRAIQDYFRTHDLQSFEGESYEDALKSNLEEALLELNVEMNPSKKPKAPSKPSPAKMKEPEPAEEFDDLQVGFDDLDF